MANKILVWDIPTRVFHWLIAISFAGAYLTAEEENYRQVHVTLGYTVIGLILFRVLWGFVGTRYARFSAFAFGPAQVFAYLKSVFTTSPLHFTGHNPAGSWAIYVILTLGVLTSVTGYMIYSGEGGEELEKAHAATIMPANTPAIAPAMARESDEASEKSHAAATAAAGHTEEGDREYKEELEELHEGIANAMLIIVLIHIAAVILSSILHRENLIRSMLSGYKAGEVGQEIHSTRWLVGIGLLAAVVAFWVTRVI